MSELRAIHPFPARMAPEIALKRVRGLGPGDVLLDPMCGSGTVLRAGVEAGTTVVGRDVDPLAVLMARVWTAPPLQSEFLREVEDVLESSQTLVESAWESLALDAETDAFIRFWFAEKERRELAAVAVVIGQSHWVHQDSLWLTFSRIIIKKDNGASVARDVSHSRPHRVAQTISYEVFQGFRAAANRLAGRFNGKAVLGTADVQLGDCRDLEGIEADSIDRIITSPPYLNAIDYMRGHRLALVWMGEALSSLRSTRSGAIGAERGLSDAEIDPRPFISSNSHAEPPTRLLGWSRRYLADARMTAIAAHRVLKSGATASLVLANSSVLGCLVDNVSMYRSSFRDAGFLVGDEETRDIPLSSRYLPTPLTRDSALGKRMKTEVVLTLHKG